MPTTSDTIVIRQGLLRRIPAKAELLCVFAAALVLIVVIPCLNAFTPETEAREQFNTHSLRSGSVQRILSAMLRAGYFRIQEA